jgi:integrase
MLGRMKKSALDRAKNRKAGGRARTQGQGRFRRRATRACGAGDGELRSDLSVPIHAELVEIWTAAGKAAPPYGAIIRLLILTGQRRGEVAGMAWDEISEDLSIWTMTGERTKNGAAHTVPVSAPVCDVLRMALPNGAKQKRHVPDDLRGNGRLILPGALGTPFAGWSKAKQALDKSIITARKTATAASASPTLIPWNVHDIRRTVATGLQRLGVRLEVTEAVLNHISGSRGGIAGVYQRHDWASEKRAALDAWAAHVVSIVKGRAPGDNVVTLEGAVDAPMRKFISEDDINSFEGWLSGAQGISPADLTPDQLGQWREIFDEITKKPSSKVGLMKLGPVPAGQSRYAVAVREGADLWLTL